MSKPFFLTRQTSDLMDGFARDLKAATGLYLIYGDSGVGKTRLLEELVQTRLAENKIRWMDLQAGSSGDGALVDSSVMIEETFARARPGDIIVADHFEMALKKTRHQLFLSWSSDGVDKELNLIVASHSNYFNDLRQLAQHYQVRIQSCQQMPFSPDDASAFLAFYLFPDRRGVKLSIPPLLQNHLVEAQGSVGKIVEIAERAGDLITPETKTKTKVTATETEAETPSKQPSRQIIAGALVAVIIVLGVGWYLIEGQSGIDGRTFAEPDNSEINLLAPAQKKPSESASDNTTETSAQIATEITTEISATEAENVSVIEEPSAENSELEHAAGVSQIESVSAVVDQGAGESAADAVQIPATASATASATGGEAEIVIVASTTAVDEYASSESTATKAAEPGEQQAGPSAAETASEITASEITASEITAPEITAPLIPASVISGEVEAEAPSAGSVAPSSSLAGFGSDRLQLDMRTSLEWIDGRAGNVGTLQIMLLSQQRFDEIYYYEYIDRLDREGVDISQIRILPTMAGSKKQVSVVYGEYESWGAAGVAGADLPSVLQQASPIPRSVGALKTEMRRLERQN